MYLSPDGHSHLYDGAGNFGYCIVMHPSPIDNELSAIVVITRIAGFALW